MEEKTFEIEKIDGIMVVNPRGYVNEKTGEAIESALREFLTNKYPRIVFDMTSCQLVNSLGVAFFFSFCMRIQEDHLGWVGFANVPHLIAQVFALSGIFPLSEQTETLAEAVDMAKSWVPED